jgi:Zn-finger nucleic acid-binding protein
VLRDDFPDCPACDGKLEPAAARLRCGACDGVLIPIDQLVDMLHVTAPDDARPLAERLTSREGARRACPRCRSAMQPAALEDIPLDWCAEHGVWFDAHELAWVLELDSLAYGRRHHRPHNGRGGQPAPPDRVGIPAPPRRRGWLGALIALWRR